MNDMTALALGRMIGEFMDREGEQRTIERAKSRRRYPQELRLGLLGAQDHRCAICLGPLGFYESHIDHIIPLAAGGEDVVNNLQLVHGSCNLRKGAKAIEGQEGLPWAR